MYDLIQDFIRYHRMIEGRAAESNTDDSDDEYNNANGDDEVEEGVASAYPKFTPTTAPDSIRDIASRGGGLFSKLHSGRKSITESLKITCNKTSSY